MSDLRPVLVVTSLHDPTADVVTRELHGRDVPVVRLDSGDFPASLSVEATISHPHGIQGRLHTPSRTADLAGVRALYYRRPTGFAFPHLDEQDARFAITQARYGLGGILAALPDCLYVNHPHRVGDAEFKPSGLAAAVDAGLDVPPTLITSSPDAARAFVKRYAPVLYKPLHNPVYRVDGVSNVVKVAEVAVEDIDDRVAGTAHLFQARIRKSADVRVTVIGRQAFCVRIDSTLLDWRTDYSQLRYTPVEPPPGIAGALRRYLAHFGLVFGAFDFCVGADGRWWFLECNPSGQWYWLEPETGLPMCAALADLLERKP
ncbi:ATP-grasp ribosomal peptide maturase [Streptomyces sp. NPDC127105]|uniref:ATP-grasp ribosomal peptide maturase n=1 Tax=Streptomyces sp. NPDC127105 TaxID=3345359 RepID=UPI00365264D4